MTEKLGFLVHESPCSPKQVYENIVRLVKFLKTKVLNKIIPK